MLPWRDLLSSQNFPWLVSPSSVLYGGSLLVTLLGHFFGLHSFVLGVAFFLLFTVVLVIFILETEVVDAMAANQMDRPFPVDDLQLGSAGNQQVHVLLVVGSTLHGTERDNNLLLVVALGFDLD